MNFGLDPKFDAFGSVQWDGARLTLTNPSRHEIYRVKLSHWSVRIVGTTSLRKWQSSNYGHWPYVQTWVQSSTFIGQTSTGAEVGLWPYPQGGRVGKIIGPFRSGVVNIYGDDQRRHSLRQGPKFEGRRHSSGWPRMWSAQRPSATAGLRGVQRNSEREMTKPAEAMPRRAPTYSHTILACLATMRKPH